MNDKSILEPLGKEKLETAKAWAGGGSDSAYATAAEVRATVAELVAEIERLEHLKGRLRIAEQELGKQWNRADKAEAEIRALRLLDSQAAEHVESQIVTRTGFTGNPPYVGWEGLGLALREALDERDKLRWQRDFAIRTVAALVTPCEECAVVRPGSMRGIGTINQHREWHNGVKMDMARQALALDDEEAAND